MKKLLLLFTGLIFLSISVKSQTYGHLNVSVSTSEAGGNFAPKNIVAIWVEDAEGNFVKTLLAYAQNRITYLNTWQASTSSAGTEFNVTDAITGATRNSHATRTCLWNGLDYNQNLMPDGTYYLWMELTDKNGTGNYSSFQFTKSEDLQELNPANEPSFNNVSLIWEPSGTGIVENNASPQFTIENNPGNGLFKINGSDFQKVKVYTVSGKFVKTFNTQTIDISDQTDGIYLFRIQTTNQLVIKKVIKRQQL